MTFEEGTCAAWLHDLLKPHVTQVLVCDPRKNALLKAGNKNDRIDARKLADLLYLNGLLSRSITERTAYATLKELARSYLALTRDLTRVMNRLKALYRSWAIPCAGQRVYAPRYRSEWLAKITEAGVRRRAEIYYQQLDALRSLREQVRRDLLAEGRKHSAMKLLRQIPSIGPIRAVLLIALMQTPHRFRTKRQLWAYSGLALKTSTSGEYRIVEGQLKRSKKFLAIRGLNAQPQSRSEKYLQGCGDPGRCRPRTVSRVLRRFSSQRDEANDGASHPGAQDRGHHFDRLEERSSFRRRTSETTSSLSVCGESIPDSSRAMAGWFSRRSGSRVSIHNPVRRVLRAPSLSRNPMPPRTTRKSDRRKVSDRTMVGTAQPLCLSASGTEGRRYDSTMNLRKRKTHSVSLHYWGWTARPFPCVLPSQGRYLS